MNPTRPHLRLTALPAAALLTLLAACGGGGDDAGAPINAVSESTASAMSANSAVVPTESTEAAATVLVTTQALVAGGTASQTYNCAGGGTAMFTVTGGSVSSIVNGQLDAGEVYRVDFSACRGSAGAATVDGAATLTVVSAGSGTTEVDTDTQGIVVTLPLRTLTLDGASRLSRTVATSGNATTVTSRWTAAQIDLTSVRSARTSTYRLSAVDVTRTVTTTSGVVSATSSSGTHTMRADLPNGEWSITTATQGAVSYDASGVPTQGNWTITLPNNRLVIGVVPGTLTVQADWGNDGDIDRTWTFSTTTLAAEAG
jgi:hypothetical protein